MKHAYLIIAHSEYILLEHLIRMIDDERNDIFIHIDKKSPPPETIVAYKSNVYFVSERVDVRWGDISQIETELNLFESACTTNRYDYYHLLSGVDLPIKSQDYIHEMCMKFKGKNFVGYAQYNVNTDLVMKYHFFTKHYRNNSFLKKGYYCMLRTVSEFLVNSVCKRSTPYYEWKKGANWVSITDDFCRYLVGRKDPILGRFRFTRCADEIFLQTELWNSPFRNTIFRTDDEFEGCLRLIDWRRGNPYTWTIHDINTIESSVCLFARKFSGRDMDIVKWIIKRFK